MVVDDEQRTLESVRVILEHDYDILTVKTAEEALRIISKGDSIDLVFLDIAMSPGINGVEALRRIKEINNDITVVMLTATNTAEAAVQVMKLGAFDYITKPFAPERIEEIVRKAIDGRCLTRGIDYSHCQGNSSANFDHIVGKSKKMRKTYELISKVTKNDATVIIIGESGTGKELVARAIHYNSLRRNQPFVVLNCAAIPENLVETELFGYEKGAFTGADNSKAGTFELANKGTIFLDEISSLKLDTQAELLRVIQEKEVERVGGLKTIKIDVRIICATNIDLKQAVVEHRFREDLYYRLNVVPIYLAPLRERKEDIPLLVEHFLRAFNRRFNKSIKAVSQEAMSYLLSYNWPGNIRELENTIERAAVLVDRDIIQTEDLPFDIFSETRCGGDAISEKSMALKQARGSFEREYILSVLERVGWNQAEAARILNIHRNTLMMKLQQLGIKRVIYEKR